MVCNNVVYGNAGYFILTGSDLLFLIVAFNTSQSFLFFKGEAMGGGFFADLLGRPACRFDDGVMVSWCHGIVIPWCRGVGLCENWVRWRCLWWLVSGVGNFRSRGGLLVFRHHGLGAKKRASV